MAHTLFRTATLAALALTTTGCVSFGGGKTPETLFNLTADQPAPAGEVLAGKSAQAVLVLDPETDRRLDVQRVAVTVDASNVAYLKDAMWVERPARLFRALLAETMRAKGTRLVFEEPDVTYGITGLRLSGRLLDIDYDAPSRSVVVRYDAILSGPGKEIQTRRFESRIENVEPKARDVGPALNDAANEVAKQVADWVG